VRPSTKQKVNTNGEEQDDKDEKDKSGETATNEPTTTDTHEHTDNETPHHDPNEKPHKEERQVGLDTNRSFVHYPENISRSEKLRLQGELNELIMTVLRKHKGLSYFQVSVNWPGCHFLRADSPYIQRDTTTSSRSCTLPFSLTLHHLAHPDPAPREDPPPGLALSHAQVPVLNLGLDHERIRTLACLARRAGTTLSVRSSWTG